MGYRSSLVACLAATVSAYDIGLKHYSQESRDGFNVLKHVGGDGPYVQRDSYGISRDPPVSCSVDQVIMIKRHGERYPEIETGAEFEELLEALYSTNITFTNELAFLNEWTYFVPDDCYLEAETTTGHYAGLSDAYNQGADYANRYGHLLEGYNGSVVPIFTSGYERVINTARKFSEGFFGYNYSTSAALNIISESATQGADSLTPICNSEKDLTTCGALTNNFSMFDFPQFDLAAARINSQTGLNLTGEYVFGLMRKCCPYSLSILTLLTLY